MTEKLLTGTLSLNTNKQTGMSVRKHKIIAVSRVLLNMIVLVWRSQNMLQITLFFIYHQKTCLKSYSAGLESNLHFQFQLTECHQKIANNKRR